MSALKILVVEDDLEPRMFYQLALLEHGHSVNVVANGAEALEVLSSEIDLVIPVLVVTAHPRDLRPELRKGMTAVLKKPFELDDFIRWVDAAASLARADN